MLVSFIDMFIPKYVYKCKWGRMQKGVDLKTQLPRVCQSVVACVCKIRLNTDAQSQLFSVKQEH